MSEFIFDEISATEQGQSNRTVRIAERAGLPNQLYQVIAFLGTYNVRISRMSDDTRAKSFVLSAEEMDTLAAQWIKFREDCISAREAEEKRVEDVKEQVLKLAQDCSAIQISEEENYYDNRPIWKIKVEDINFTHDAYGLDQLLDAVNAANEQYIEHLLRIDEVKSIAKAHPEIKIQVSNNTAHKYWKVSIPSQNWQYSFPIYSSIDLVLQAKEALQVLESHQKLQAESADQIDSGSTTVEPVQSLPESCQLDPALARDGAKFLDMYTEGEPAQQ